MTTLSLPTQNDPIARLALIALACGALWLAAVMPSAPAQAQVELATPAPIIVIATPTMGLQPTEAPALVLAPPTFAPPLPEQPTPEPQVVYVEVTPAPTEAPPAEPTAPPVTALPQGSIVILPTATQTKEEFIASFGPTPDPAAKCAFIGCLAKP
jgi:hypothetical protein